MTAVEVEVRSGTERLDERSPRRRGRRNERLLGIAEHSVAILLTAVFLGPIVLIVLTAFLVHKGSHESKDSDDEMQASIDRLERKVDELAQRSDQHLGRKAG